MKERRFIADIEEYNDEIRNMRSNGVAVIDLASAMPKDSKYYYDFMHYTNAGAEKVASIISDSLRFIADIEEYNRQSTITQGKLKKAV